MFDFNIPYYFTSRIAIDGKSRVEPCPWNTLTDAENKKNNLSFDEIPWFNNHPTFFRGTLNRE